MANGIRSALGELTKNAPDELPKNLYGKEATTYECPNLDDINFSESSFAKQIKNLFKKYELLAKDNDLKLDKETVYIKRQDQFISQNVNSVFTALAFIATEDPSFIAEDKNALIDFKKQLEIGLVRLAEQTSEVQKESLKELIEQSHIDPSYNLNQIQQAMTDALIDYDSTLGKRNANPARKEILQTLKNNIEPIVSAEHINLKTKANATVHLIDQAVDNLRAQRSTFGRIIAWVRRRLFNAMPKSERALLKQKELLNLRFDIDNVAGNRQKAFDAFNNQGASKQTAPSTHRIIHLFDNEKQETLQVLKNILEIIETNDKPKDDQKTNWNTLEKACNESKNIFPSSATLDVEKISHFLTLNPTLFNKLIGKPGLCALLLVPESLERFKQLDSQLIDTLLQEANQEFLVKYLEKDSLWEALITTLSQTVPPPEKEKVLQSILLNQDYAKKGSVKDIIDYASLKLKVQENLEGSSELIQKLFPYKDTTDINEAIESLKHFDEALKNDALKNKLLNILQHLPTEKIEENKVLLEKFLAPHGQEDMAALKSIPTKLTEDKALFLNVYSKLKDTSNFQQIINNIGKIRNIEQLNSETVLDNLKTFHSPDKFNALNQGDDIFSIENLSSLNLVKADELKSIASSTKSAKARLERITNMYGNSDFFGTDTKEVLKKLAAKGYFELLTDKEIKTICNHMDDSFQERSNQEEGFSKWLSHNLSREKVAGYLLARDRIEIREKTKELSLKISDDIREELNKIPIDAEAEISRLDLLFNKLNSTLVEIEKNMVSHKTSFKANRLNKLEQNLEDYQKTYNTLKLELSVLDKGQDLRIETFAEPLQRTKEALRNLNDNWDKTIEAKKISANPEEKEAIEKITHQLNQLHTTELQTFGVESEQIEAASQRVP